MPTETYIMRKQPTKKEWFKFIKYIKDPYLCEALITGLEAQKAKLNPNLTSKTP